LVYHTLNRAKARLTIFEDDGDFAAFERILADAVTRYAMRLLAYCLMPNHFHLLLWPRGDGDLSRFMQWLTLTHTQRWHAHRHTIGCGRRYQGRFKSSPVQTPAEEEAVQRSIRRGQPYGTEPWQKRTASRLRRESTFRPRGRLSKKPNNGS
jgi:putative transposase